MDAEEATVLVPNGVAHSEETEMESGSPTPEVTSEKLSKNKLRKLRNYERILHNRRIKKQHERSVRKQGGRQRRHIDEKVKIAEKLLKAQESGPQVVIDCQFTTKMSVKEQRRLCQQLCRVYASNKAAAAPLHLHFTSLDESSAFFETCCQMNPGFANYTVDRSDKSFLELFPLPQFYDQLVYLSPDAPEALEGFDPSKIYVIGGLVDETIQKNVTQSFSQSQSIVSARLPILEHFEFSQQGTSKLVLAVNQVVDIILKWYETRNWTEAIQAGLPSRTGFTPKLKCYPESRRPASNRIENTENCSSKDSSDI